MFETTLWRYADTFSKHLLLGPPLLCRKYMWLSPWMLVNYPIWDGKSFLFSFPDFCYTFFLHSMWIWPVIISAISNNWFTVPGLQYCQFEQAMLCFLLEPSWESRRVIIGYISKWLRKFVLGTLVYRRAMVDNAYDYVIIWYVIAR